MAKQRKLEDESKDQASNRRYLEGIANTANRSDKVSWNRKMDNMVKLIAEMRPYQEEILDIEAKKAEIFDRIKELRKTMVAECIHPYDHLVNKENHVYCKFCERKIVPNASTQE